MSGLLLLLPGLLLLLLRLGLLLLLLPRLLGGLGEGALLLQREGCLQDELGGLVAVEKARSLATGRVSKIRSDVRSFILKNTFDINISLL